MNTNYFLNVVASNVFLSDGATPLPASYYLGMSTTAPTAAGTGATEPSSSAGYTRIKLTDLSDPSNGAVTNTNDIDFPESLDDWGTITHYVIFDAATGGHLLMYGALEKSRRMDEGCALTVRAGDLDLVVFNGSV